MSPFDFTPLAPAYGEASLSDVLPGVLAALGVPDTPDPLGLATGALAGVRSVGVLLIDGLGYYALPHAATGAPVLADLVAGRVTGASLRAITTGFPSTTPTSVVSLATGAAPGAHGIVGFTLNVPGTDTVLNHIRWGDEPDPWRWQPLTTQFARAARAGVAARVVVRPEFRDTGLTGAAYRGAEFVGSSTVDSIAGRMLAGMARPPAVVFGYLSDVDQVAHRFGNNSPQWMDAVRTADRLLARLVDGLTPGSALVVTADHGHLDVPADHRFDLDTDARLRAGVRVAAGEARVRYLHTEPGAADDVRAAWTGVLGPAADVLSRDEAVAAGLFGPVAPDHLARVGDVVVICRDDYAVIRSLTDPPEANTMVGFHGSRTTTEMTIPLLVVRAQ